MEYPLFWWLLLTAIATVIIIAAYWRRRTSVDPLKEQLDHFCRCYARGEISRDDFEELKKIYRHMKRRRNLIKKERQHPIYKHWK